MSRADREDRAGIEDGCGTGDRPGAEGRAEPKDRSSHEGRPGPGRRPAVLVIVGPTGVGKTEVACLVAKTIGGEIVSADSRQIYRGMDIGTDKPDKATLQEVRHHMIDIVDPSEQFDAAQFCSMARRCFLEIASRDRVPMLVGGTGLYVKAALYGLFPGPSRDEDLRARLLATEAQSPGALHARLARVDPRRAAQLSSGDVARIVRALEYFELTGDQMSEAQAGWTVDSWPYVAVGLVRPRRELYQRIDARVLDMAEGGLFDEVRSLLNGGVSPDAPAFRSIGYKEALVHLMGHVEEEQAIFLIQRNSRRYAKKQVTWFKRMSVRRWIRVVDPKRAADEIFEEWRGTAQ